MRFTDDKRVGARSVPGQISALPVGRDASPGIVENIPDPPSAIRKTERQHCC